MKKLAISSLCLLISGCGLFQTPPPPTPGQVLHNLNQVPSGTTVNVVSLIPLDVPNSSQPKVVNTALFRVSMKVLGQPNSTVLILQNAFVTAVYSNDGHNCQLSWQAIYPDYQAMEQNQGELSFGAMVNNNSCDPKTGIRPGQNLNIVFK